ncbi:latrophilin-like protein 1 [Amphiura filiformis]|uniref:latrophilin-like protein 1 n=1 Tax=Amphiura filiformis TaxID=82378 RepID=UPI003B210472
MMFRIYCILLTWYALLMPVSGQSESGEDKIVCEDEKFHLTCEERRFINVTSAIYGRQDGIKCPDPEHVSTTSCAAKNSLQIVQDLCNWKRMCEVHASNGVFGDPCPGTAKYLEISFRCIEAMPSTTPMMATTKSMMMPMTTKRGKGRKKICPESVTNTNNVMFSWTRTDPGHTVTAQSNETCPNDSERQIASRKCTQRGMWRDPVFIGCGIEDLAKIQVTEDNVAEIADALANIIEDSETIDVENIQEAFTKIVNVGSPSPVVTESVIKTVNSILSANVSQGDSAANALSEILKSVEMQVENTIEMYGTFSSVKPNIAVEGVAVNKAQGGVGFAISQIEGGFKKDSNESFDMQSEDQLIGSSIQLPEDALFENENTNDTKVSFIAYNDDKLFPSQMLKEKTSSMVVGPIISAVVLGKDVKNLQKPVVIQIAPTQDINATVLNTSRCVYWDSKSDGIGDWADEGCELMSAKSGKITCHCNHLTNFAVLVDFSGGTMHFALDVISKIGCASSIVGLCLTLMIFLCCRQVSFVLL